MDPSKDPKPIRSSWNKYFSRSPIDPCTPPSKVAGEAVELNVEKKTERTKLFEGASSETKPRQRTAEEIKAKYRKKQDTSTAAMTAASDARDKLLERQEKLERISQNAEELSAGAENFASLAKELAKRKANRKWWKL